MRMLSAGVGNAIVVVVMALTTAAAALSSARAEWVPLGGLVITGNVAVGLNGDTGQLEVFARESRFCPVVETRA